MPRCTHTTWLVLIALMLGIAVGCTAPMRPAPTGLITQGEYGQAREVLLQHQTHRKASRQYLLDRMRLAILTLADGYPQSAQYTLEQVYEILRTQGINEDRTVASVALYEGVKIWKGEPFEQALALMYYGVQQGMLGQWDNVRAAADNSLFRLRDFSTDDMPRERIDSEAIARRALEHERQQREQGVPAREVEDFLNTGYAVRESNFTLGYLLHGIASRELHRQREAEDFFAVVVQQRPDLRPMMQTLRDGEYNTILVVSYGLGPRKVAYGPDNALARFTPRTRSDEQQLLVGSGDGAVVPHTRIPLVSDVNRMAMDHMWNNLEDVRIAKSVLGDVMLTAGAITVAVGSHNDNPTAQLVGLGLMLGGLVSKAGAHADTRYCDAFPQRYYVVPVKITEPGQRVELMVEGVPQSRIVLTGLAPPPPGEPAQLRYVRLVSTMLPSQPPGWAVSGRIYYSNDRTGPVPGPQRPFVLGGNDVRYPGAQALRDYHAAGDLLDTSLIALEDIYRAEGLRLRLDDGVTDPVGRHVLEGGRSLIPPMTGTVGFARLFGQVHPPYIMRSAALRNLTRQLTGQGEAMTGARSP